MKAIIYVFIFPAILQFALANPTYVIDQVRALNHTLDHMSLGNYTYNYNSSRSQFTRDWYAYEDEYLHNWDRG